MQNPPVVKDGNGSLELKALWNKSLDTIPDLAPLQNAKVILSSQYGMQIYYTGSDGFLRLTHLPAADYNVAIRGTHPNDPTIILVASNRGLNICSGQSCCYTDTAKPVSNSGIAINEIYCSGPVNNIFYMYDLFIELYNSSDSVKYLDGMMIMRVSGSNNGTFGQGADWYHDGRMQGVTYAYKFPGRAGEKNYPFKPKKFLVLAGDAVDHRKAVATSIDLTHADWEFYNQFMGADIDNPNVPNLINLRSDNTSKFLINMVSDVIALSSGVDSVWTDGIDISNIIDAVQYSNSPSTHLKTIDDRLDRGQAPCPARYSGQSMQRREPGMDTNDGGLDWEIIPHPTPGWQ
jgi:hypothetical protein